MMDSQKLVRDYPIKYENIAKLLSNSDELLTNLHPETGHGYILKILENDCIDDIPHLMNRLSWLIFWSISWINKPDLYIKTNNENIACVVGVACLCREVAG